MPKITVNIPQRLYDALNAQAAVFNADKLSKDPAFVPLVIDDWVDKFVVTPRAKHFADAADAAAQATLQARYLAAAPAIQTQVDSLLPILP